MYLVAGLLIFTAGTFAVPVGPPVYHDQQQYVPVQPLPPQYRQYYLSQGTPTATPVHEPQPEIQQPTQQQYTQQQAAQPLLRPIDKQIQKAAYHLAGPQYVNQIQNLQLQEQSQQQQIQLQRNALRVATAPRAQPIQYQRQPQSQPLQASIPVALPSVQYERPQAYERPQTYERPQRPQPSAQRYVAQPSPPNQQQIAEQYDSNPSYQFGFDVKDDTFTNYQNRKEQRDGDKITGSYSVVDSDGFIRTVTYTADPKNGFKAEVSRKPTDIVVKVPTPQPPTQNQQQYHRQPQSPQYYEAAAEQIQAQSQQSLQSPQPQDIQNQKHRFLYQYQ